MSPFRRFAVIFTSETHGRYETEVTLSLSHIVRINRDNAGNCYIACADGSLWLSAVDYKTLTDALDGEHRYH